MLWLFSCILTKNSEITSECFLSDCDTSLAPQSIDVYFEPTLITLDEEVTCRSTQAFPFATAQYRWLQNDQTLNEVEDSLLLSSPSFQSGDRIECQVEWMEDSTVYAAGIGAFVIP